MRAPYQLLLAFPRPFATHRNSTTISTKNPAPEFPSKPESIETLAQTGRLKAALRSLILRRHLGEPVPPDSFVSILKPCSSNETLMQGKQLHAHMTVTGFNRDTFVCNHLINMYGKCGSLGDAHWVFREIERKNLHSWNTLLACYCKFGVLSEARQLFDEMRQRDSVSWNTMISGYDQHGPCEEALHIFVRMRHSDCRIDHFGVSSVVSACCNLRFVRNGKELHGYSFKIGLNSEVHVGSALIGLYSKCSEIEDAKTVFDGMSVREPYTWNSMLAGYVQCSKIDEALLFFREMPEKNVVSWTTIIAGCSQHEQNEEAIGFFHKMRVAGLWSDQVSFGSVLNACVGLLDFKEGFKIHGQIVKSGFETNVFVGSVLVALYAKCGSLNDARCVIDGMPFVDDFSWSVLIAEYAKHGHIDCARPLFESLEVKSVPMWNALIGGYSELGLDEEAFGAFKEMLMGGTKGDEFTYGSLLMGSDLLGLGYGKQLHLQAIKAGVSSSVFVGSALIDMYSKYLECEAAERVFNSIHEPNLVSWNAMVSGYGQNNLGWEALHMFRVMMVSGIKPDNTTFSCVLDSCSSLLALPWGRQVHALAYKLVLESDVVVGSALIDMYAKCGNLDDASLAFSDIHQHNVVSWTALVGSYLICGIWDTAMELFNMMPERNVVSWNAMLSGYSKHGCGLEALDFYSQMNKSGVLPDRITFVTLLTVCCNFLLEEHGKQVHAQIIKTGYYMNAHVRIALTNMYQKLGKLPDKMNMESSSIRPKLGNFPDTAEPDAISGIS